MDRRRRKTREAILDAFRKLFFERGYDALLIGDVAVTADVGRSTLYTHFRRKEDLLRASMAHLLLGLAGATTAAGDAEISRVMAHFWENRRHRAIFSPGACRNVLAAALAGLIEQRLGDPLCFERPPRWRLPPALAARLIADHQLNLIDHWLSGQSALAAPAMTEVMKDSVRALCDTLRTG